MKNKRTLTIAIAVIGLALLTAFGIFRIAPQTQAQDQQPPPVPDRVSFGLVGITSGQSVRMSVANTLEPNDPNLPPGPVRVVMAFRNANGQIVRNSRGEIIRKAVNLARGESTFLEVDYGDLPPGPIRQQIRGIIICQQPPPTNEGNAIPDGSVVPTVEVINANGRTQYAVFTHPAVMRGINQQPYELLGQ